MSDESDSERIDDQEYSGSDDGSYDYGFAEDEEDDDDSAYEVDYANMNVSPELLRMLGASEDVIAEKEAEISGVKWVAPTKTGLEHSSAIAASDEVALGPGRKIRGSVDRVFAKVGNYRDSSEDMPALKVKVAHAPEPVPEKKEFMMPPQPEGGEYGDSSSDSSWDEASVVDGRTWWETQSDEDLDEDINLRMSPNLRMALGLAVSHKDEAAGSRGKEDPAHGTWRAPTFSGLNNSVPVRTLKPLAVGQQKGLEVEYKKPVRESGAAGVTNDQDTDEEEKWSDEEGWDFEDVPDENYIMDWSTNISPNLAKALGGDNTSTPKTALLSKELTWIPPASSGLSNSSPLIKASGAGSFRLNRALS